MSQKPTCEQCGGREFVIESGFYFCAECNVQSQDIREQVFDEYYSGQRGTRVVVAPPPETKQIVVTDTLREVTSWEVVNFVVKGLVDELMRMGASKEFKHTVLQLWATYLKKLEVAFMSFNIEKRPRLGVTFRKRDAEIVYRAGKETVKACRSPVSRKRSKRDVDSSSDSKLSSSGHSHRSEKIRMTLKKKALAKAEYEQMSESSQSSALTLESLGKSSTSDGSQKSYKLRYTDHAKSSLLELMENAEDADPEERLRMQKKLLYQEKTSLHHINFTKAISIIRIALLITKSPIQLCDIFRWSREGYISLRNLEKLLPIDIKVQKDIKLLFMNQINSWSLVQRCTRRLVKFLKAEEFKVDILGICKRFCTELRLPNEVVIVIEAMLRYKPPKLKVTVATNYEGRAIALIIVVLKMIFSIDDVTESSISKVAYKLNSKLGKGRRLFNWKEWVEYINCRTAVVARECHVTREIHFPTSRVGGSGPFISQWDYTPQQNLINRGEEINPNLSMTLRRLLERLACEAREPLKPSMMPMTTKTEAILKKNLANNVRHILEKDFSDTNILWLSSPERCKEVLVECESEARIVEGVGVEFKLSNKVTGDVVARSRVGRSKAWVDVRMEKTEESENEREMDGDSICSGSTTELKAIWIDLLEDFEEEDECEGGDVYVGASEYWLQHGSVTTLSLDEFDLFSRSSFPRNFSWLLGESSKMIGQSTKDIYVEVVQVERVFLPLLKSRCMGFRKYW